MKMKLIIKEKFIQFSKNFILMAIIMSVIVFIFFKLNIVNEFNIFYIVGFMIIWSIWQVIKLYIANKKYR